MRARMLINVMSTWFGNEPAPNHVGWNTVEVQAGDYADIEIDSNGNITRIDGRELIAPMEPQTLLGRRVYE